MMTGDGKCIGTKYGISFVGKWVWRMKDYIDRGFMTLFDPNYLFKDYATQGTAEPLVNTKLFEDEENDPETQEKINAIKQRVKVMDVETAGKILSCDEEEEEFHERLAIIMRAHTDTEFEKGIVSNFKPTYYKWSLMDKINFFKYD